MLRMSSPYTRFSEATSQVKLWLADAVVCGLLGIFILDFSGGRSYFNLGININRPSDHDDRFESDNFETIEALPKNISGRYANQVSVPI